MDKITKFLSRLSRGERRKVQETLTALHEGETVHLDLKKLKGAEDVYRVRLGNLRILFLKKEARGDIRVLEIARRSEKTYRDF